MAKTNKKNDNAKYGVRPEILAQIVFTEKDKIFARSFGEPSSFIQGILATPPEDWSDEQLERAKVHKLNKKTLDDLRYWMDNEPEPQGNYPHPHSPGAIKPDGTKE